MSSPQYLSFVTVDVFTEERYKGNPLAIVRVPKSVELEQETKQLIAREFNLSETVFIHEGEEGSSDRKIDIFIPDREVPFAGHPTIGTICHVCAGTDLSSNPIQQFTLHTKAGPIAATYDPKARLAVASIPHNVNIHQSSVHLKHILDAQPSLIHGRGEAKAWNRREDGSEITFPIVSIVNGMTFILVDFPSVEDYLEKLGIAQGEIDPDITKLDAGWSSTIVVTYYYAHLPDQGDQTTRLRCRLIMSVVGEDPATGSAASALGCYLSLQKGEANKTYTYKIEQGVEMGRRSQIGVEVTLDANGKGVKEVLLLGTATPLMHGSLMA